jgi:PAS domain S-box-containing protein
MKIRSKLRIVAILPIGLVILVVCIMLFAARGIRDATRLEHAAREVVTDIYELNERVAEILGPLDHEEKAFSRWLSQHRELGRDLWFLVGLKPADQLLFDRMTEHHKAIGVIFNEIYENRRKAWDIAGGAVPTLERDKDLIMKLMNVSRMLVEDATTLATSAEKAEMRAISQAAWSILLWTLCLALAMGVFSALTTRSVNRSIEQLQRDTAAVGRGDLDRWEGTGTDDEIGQLSQSVGRMVANLKSITASRDDLNKEVAERKRVQERLAQHDKLMREWLNVCTDGVWDWDLETNWQYMSPRFWELFGYPPDEKRHDPEEITEMVHPEDKKKAMAEFDRHVRSKGEQPYRVEVRYLHKDGSTVYVIRRGQVIEWGDDGSPKRMVGTQTDITKLKQTEAALRESEERFREISENLQELVWLTSAGGDQVLYLNPAYEKIWGRVIEDCYRDPKDWTEAVHPDDRERVGEAFFEGAAANGFDQEYRIVRPNGELRWIWDRGFPVRDDAGEVIHIAGIAEDITERKRQAEILQRKTDELARSNQELEQFAYVASHDLQEPLRKIEAFGELLLTTCRDALPEQGHEYVDRMQNASRRMHTLIDDVLRLARITIGPVAYKPVNLGDTVRDVLLDLEAALQATRGQVEVGDLPVVEAEPVQMRQLMQNLIGNAIKFHRPEASPHVKIYSGHDGYHTHSLGTDDRENECRIIIEDNGIGFDQKHADRIFRMFQRLHRRDEFAGTGVGLAICQKILDLHGGTIRVESEPGVGSRFIVTLPLQKSSMTT